MGVLMDDIPYKKIKKIMTLLYNLLYIYIL